MKISHCVSLAIIGSLIILGCEPTPDQKDSATVQSQMDIYQRNQPIPILQYSQDRDNLIQIYQMKATEARVTHAVVRGITGEYLWDCPSVGFPLPADTQLTNPLVTDWRTSGGAVIEQAEPNGLFTSKNTDGTYVLCVLSDGSVSPQYTEMKAETFTRPISVDEKGKVRFIDGVPSMVLKKKVN